MCLLLKILLIALIKGCLSGGGAQFRVHREPFSTSETEIQGKHVMMDEVEAQTFTHYLSRRPAMPKFNFTVHVHENGAGIFVERWALVELERMKQEKKTNPICSTYDFHLTYVNGDQEEEDGESAYLCKDGKFTESQQDVFLMENFRGPGTVFVNVTYRGFKQFDFGPSGPVVNLNGRRIPGTSIGGLTFTLFKDCRNMSEAEIDQKELRSCSRFHNWTCIARNLFCDGDVNCVTLIREYAFAVNTNFTEGHAQIVTPSFDESIYTCGASSLLQWRQPIPMDAFNFNYTFKTDFEWNSPVKKNANSGMGWKLGVGILTFVLAVTGMCCKAFRKSDRTPRAEGMEGRQRQMDRV